MTIIITRRHHQLTIRINLSAQEDYLCFTSDKSLSVFCNHTCPFDNVAVEGLKSIRNTAAGSGAGCGLRAISCGSALGVCAQPVSKSKVSASDGIAHRLGRGEFIRVFRRVCSMCRFLQCGLCFVGAGGFGKFEWGSGVLRLDVRNLLSIPPFLRLPANTKSQSTGHYCGGSVGVEAGDHRQPFHQYQHITKIMGFIFWPPECVR